MKVNSISFGDYVAVESGSFITYDEKDTRIQFMSGSENATVVFRFHSDQTGEKKTVVNISGDELIVDLYNYDNPLGTGSSVPSKIFENEAEEVYLSYRVYSFDNTASNKLVHYTFYSKQKNMRTKRASGKKKHGK